MNDQVDIRGPKKVLLICEVFIVDGVTKVKFMECARLLCVITFRKLNRRKLKNQLATH